MNQAVTSITATAPNRDTLAWQRAGAGDWTSYAADVSRRTTQH